MRFFQTRAASLFITLASVAGARAAEPREGVPFDLVLQRFAVAKGGDVLLIPVRFSGKDRLFMVDTGFSRTVFDSSLPLGEPRGVSMGMSPQGLFEMKIFDPPVASVGHLPLRVSDEVGSFDLKEFRQLTGHPIEGILGMDFLGRYVVHIDFDQGELSLLKSAPQGARTPVRFAWQAGEAPTILAEFAGGQKVRFIVDTGAVTYNSGIMEILKMRGLARKGVFHEIGATKQMTVLGKSSARLYRAERMGLGGFEVKGPVFSEVLQTSNLGLGFWSRFTVTFDFPKRTVYMSRGKSFDRPEFFNASGLHLVKKDCGVEVNPVDPGSPGAKAGVQAGDLLLEVEGVRAGEASLFALRAALCKEGRLDCVLRRGSQDYRVTVTVPQ